MLQQYQTILVAVDGSTEAELAFKKAVNVAKRNYGKLLVAHVIDTRAFQSLSNYDTNLAEEAKNNAKEILEEYVNYAKNNGVDNIEYLIEYGSPKTAIAEHLPKKYNVELIMVGATGLTAVERLLIGSVSEYIIRHAVCDILVVRTDLNNKPVPRKSKKDNMAKKE